MTSKRIPVLALLLASLFWSPAWASGGTPEVGIGVTLFQRVANGTWFQLGFKNHESLSSTAWMLGWRQPLSHRLALHFDWVSLGSASSWSMDTPADSNYNTAAHACNGKCLPMANYVGEGSASGLAVTLSRHFGRGGWLTLNGGLYINRVKWAEQVYGWQPNPAIAAQDLSLVHHTHWEIAPAAGVGIRHGKWAVEGEYYFVKSTGDSIPAIFNGAGSIMLRAEF